MSVLCLFSVTLSAQASWFIDPKKFHASVHGQRSCQDCHEELGKGGLHPNPEDTVKNKLDFFDPDHCLICHGDIQQKLDEGIHGSKKIESPKAYDKCLSCHDPHEQSPVKEPPGRFDASKPRQEQCGVCHEEKKSLPTLLPEDEACMACHRAIDPIDLRAAERMANICFHCHAQKGTEAQKLTAAKISLINPEEYEFTAHAGESCTLCHPVAAEFDHDQQKSADCRQCHLPHDEKVTHDFHGLVACEACHLGGIQPVRDSVSQLVTWKRVRVPGEPSRIHDVVVKHDEKTCRKCHRTANQIGAAAMVLPPKSIICMPCHAASFSVGDTTTIISLAIFLIGLVLVFSYVLSGSTAEGKTQGIADKCIMIVRKACGAVFSDNVLSLAKVFFTDVLLQRRLYRQSRSRWVVHSLIFYPFVLRFLWGMIALIGSLWKREWPWIWDMLDKNSAVTGFVFDLTGIILILGVIVALLRGARRRLAQLPDLPKQDRAALVLIGGIAAVGFVLEGMRIAMTGFPDGAAWAFLGYAISKLFGRGGGYLVNLYGYGWYLHAVLAGAFIAYIPFSRLLHIIFGPLVLVGNAVKNANGAGHKEEANVMAKEGNHGNTGIPNAG